MKFLFSKYSGCGNDFVLIDDREEIFPIQTPKLVTNICHRRQGIGADGVILLQKSCKADFRMRILNSDGSEAEMCGNGIRCLMKFIQEVVGPRSACTVESAHRLHRVALDSNDVSVEMGTPQEVQWDVDVPLSNDFLKVHRLNTGVPHAVEFVEDLEKVNIKERGPLIRHHPLFAPKGTNYNAAKVSGRGVVSVRTFERGVEGETLACGTGATAVALAAAKTQGLSSPVKVHTKSGENLKIYFEMITGHPEQVWMAGPAHKVYGGTADFDTFLG